MIEKTNHMTSKTTAPQTGTTVEHPLRVRTLTRRSLFAELGATAVAAGIAVSCTKPAAAVPALTSSYIPILDCVPIVVAYAKNFFAEAGIKADKPVLIRTWPALMEAFTAKQTLLTHILLPQVLVLRYGRKIPLRSVAFNHTDVVAMMLAKGVRELKDLGGKTVGCPTWWAPHTGIFQDVLRQVGLKPVVGKEEKDLARDEVAFRVIAPPDMVDGLKSQRIAGCSVSEPFGAAAEILAGATLVKMSGDVWKEHPCCQSVMLEETINRDRQWSEAVTTAIFRACLWAHNNREEVADLLGKDGGGYFPMPKAIIRRALLKQDLATYGPDGTGAIMHTNWNVYRVKFNPYPYPSAFDITLEMMRRMVVDPSTPLPPVLATAKGQEVDQTIVDYDLANKALAAVGGEQAFGVTGPKPLQRTEQYQVVLKASEATR